jgi:two-component system LytT family response regulator
MIRAVIIDDEQSNVDTLCSLLKEYGLQVEVSGSASSIAQAVSMINKEKPQLVFLDVELGKETAFELFRSFPEPDFEVIFTTAHEKYALQAIKASALEFLLKPIDPKELTAAIRKFEKESRKETDRKKIEALLQNSVFGKAGQKIAIPSADGYSFIDSSDIVCCEADMNYTYVYSGKERVLSSRTLKEFEEMLDPSKFFRCHKSWLINLDHIRKYSRTDGTRVLMANEKWVDISVRKREEFLKLFEKF